MKSAPLDAIILEVWWSRLAATALLRTDAGCIRVVTHVLLERHHHEKLGIVVLLQPPAEANNYGREVGSGEPWRHRHRRQHSVP